MSRLKTFGKYLLLLVVFYIVSTILAIGCIRTTYGTMEGTIYPDSNISVNVDKAESTFVNGYIKGTVTSNADIESKYIKIELLSGKSNVIMVKYIQIDEINANETQNFTINFEAENIKSFNIKVVDEYVQEHSKTQLINMKDAENEQIKNISIFMAAIILLKYVIL